MTLYGRGAVANYHRNLFRALKIWRHRAMWRIALDAQTRGLVARAHADADRESPLDSAVTSHDAGGNYKLMHATFTTARYPFNADLVTVSACQPHDSPVDYFRSRDRH